MTVAEINNLLQKLARCLMTSRHVRIIDPHHLYLIDAWHIVESIEVRLPVVLVCQIILDHVGSTEFIYRRVGWITRVWHEHLVAGIDKCHCHMHNTFLASYERQKLGSGIEIHTIPLLIEVRPSLAQLWQSRKSLVTMRIRATHIFNQSINSAVRRTEIRASHTEVDDRHASVLIHHSYLLEFAREVVFFDMADTLSRLYSFH